MDKERIKGKAEDVAGRVERQVGEWTGNEKAQAEGLAKQAEGKARNAVGKTKDAVRDAADKLKETKIENEEDRGLSAIKTLRSSKLALQHRRSVLMGAPFVVAYKGLCSHRTYHRSDSPFTARLWHSYGMKTKNMRELEKMWAKKASEQSNPQQKAGTPTRQTPTHTTRTARKSSRGR